MRFDELKTALKTQIDFAYFIAGKDAFLRSSAEKMITKRCVDGFLELNISKFNDENYSLEGFLDALMLAPFGSLKRVVVLSDVSLNSSDQKKILEVLKAKSDLVCVIFKYAEIPNSLQKIKNECTFVDCDPLEVDTLRAIIVNKFAQNHIKIEANAVQTLIDYTNGDMTFIDQEMKKLIAYSKDAKMITEADVILLVHKNIEYSVFELSNAVADKNREKAIELLDLMLKNKESPQNLLGMLLANFRRIFYVSVSKESASVLANALGVKEYSIKIAKRMALKFTPKKLKKILDIGGKIDFDIKNSKMEDKNAIYYFVSNILML